MSFSVRNLCVLSSLKSQWVLVCYLLSGLCLLLIPCQLMPDSLISPAVCPERACTLLLDCFSWSAVTFPSSLVVPPSAPLCRIQGSLEVGSDITLTCSSEEGIPRPTYLWEKLDNVPKLPPTATQGACSVDYPLTSQVAAWSFLCLSCQRWHGSLSVCHHLHDHLFGTKIPGVLGGCVGLGTHQQQFKVSSYFGMEPVFPVEEQGSFWMGAREYGCQMFARLEISAATSPAQGS